ncbi:MAG: hypothetical protein KAR20_18570, partial [Candidatus Heimdallarchaeota archaeon]|nr:hypothetical protein [Candidatus Heimdallarchaeota archaeon]
MSRSNYKFPGRKNTKEPTVPHKLTPEEYQDARKTVFTVINKINDTISPVVNPVKRRILTMAIQNITDSIDLYFNQKTYRTNPRQDEIFARSTQEVSNIVQFLPVSKEKSEIIAWVEQEISKIKVQFKEQHAYL